MESEIRKLLDQLRTGFNPSARPDDEQLMGILMARFFKWEGDRCVEALLYALEESNFHSTARAIKKAWESGQLIDSEVTA